ncbi:hypothetical protein AVEN_90741-1 [Araneus ventricosus]|uniref:Uncharacterized protein n=1 Tax=Araneus ventricosus TaxID=182803 RepID=A0A4Y2SXQ5_ARAVE|nr:hypothetical protein AVEN_90741-1 [Araneus ventricosus]
MPTGNATPIMSLYTPMVNLTVMSVRLLFNQISQLTRHFTLFSPFNKLYAIYLRLLKIITLNFKKAIIYTDSRSGIQAQQSGKYNKHLLVMECFELLRTLKGIKIKYCWIPGHAGIPGKECADKAAKTSNTARETFVPLNGAFHADKISQQRVWQRNLGQTDKQ